MTKNHSFSIVEEAEFHATFDYLNPSVSARKANITHTTLREKIIAAFEQHKQKVIEALGKAPGLINISFDGWRSGNRYTLYGICCFFRDENNKPCKITLGLPEVSARHTEPNIAAEILDIIESYQIQDKIGYFTLDNAKNNDIAMAIIGGELQRTAFDESPDPNVKTKKPLDVVLDNDTRWLSQLYMIRRALLLRDYIERLIIAHHRIDFEQQNKAKRGGPKKSPHYPLFAS